jgi:hypothetical protein
MLDDLKRDILAYPGIWIGIAIMVVACVMIFTALTRIKHLREHPQSETATAYLESAFLRNYGNEHDVCVSTLPAPEVEGELYCTSIFNVKVTTYDVRLGTSAAIHFRRNVPMETAGVAGIPRTVCDFIEIFVRTDAERTQWRNTIEAARKQYYDARDVKLEGAP